MLPTTAMRARRELARTRSSGSSTTVGTRALLAIEYAFWNTSALNAVKDVKKGREPADDGALPAARAFASRHAVPMTTPIKLSIPHQLGRVEARSRIESGFANMARQVPGSGSVLNQRWDGDRLTVWEKTQYVQGTVFTLSGEFGIPPDHIRVISPFIGGAFGNAARAWVHSVIAAMAAREVKRPVKLVLTRRQMYFTVGFRPAYEYGLRLGADRGGRDGEQDHCDEALRHRRLRRLMSAKARRGITRLGCRAVRLSSGGCQGAVMAADCGLRTHCVCG